MDPESAFGISGLTSLFKECTQLFGLIDSSPPDQTDFDLMSKADFDLVSTILEIEQVRLCIWGQAVGLATDGQGALDTTFITEVDDRLKDRRISAAISDILTCIKDTIKDSRSLKRRYRLLGTDTTGFPESSNSTPRTTFKRTLDRFNFPPETPLNASTKFVIADENLFPPLVEDLRRLNASLTCLLPDIDSFTRQQITNDISDGLNAEELRLIEQAAFILFYIDFGDAATERLEEINEEKAQAVADASSASAASTQTMDMDELVRRVEELEIKLHVQNKGMLEVSILEIYDKYSSHVTWDGVRGDEWHSEIAKELEVIKPPYLAWGLQYVTEIKMKNENRPLWSERWDPEAGRKYTGKLPGSKTVAGYASEFQHWAYDNFAQKSETYFLSTHLPPSLIIRQLAERINVLQGLRKLPPGWTNKQNYEELEKWIGKTDDIWIDHDYRYSMVNQVSSLLSMLNRKEIFEDWTVGGSIGHHLHGTKPRAVVNYLLQMILAYELRLRLENSDTWVAGMTPNVLAALEMAHRWMESIKIVLPDEGNFSLTLHSLVHERQVEGLIRFAEAMDWPKLLEMREYTEGVYARHIAGSAPFSFTLWNWLFGLVLSGGQFVYHIMGALVCATPSHRSLGSAKYYAASLIIDGKSYWRAKSAVGRVFGGMRGIKEVCGWVGPCPAPIEDSITGWVRTRAAEVGFAKPGKIIVRNFDFDDDSVFRNTSTSSWATPKEETLTPQWFADMNNKAKWKAPEAPKPSSERCEFLGLHLKELQSSTPPEVPQDQEYRASIDFKVDGKPITYTLFSKPSFVASHPCINGPHLQHSNDMKRFKNVCAIRDLKKLQRIPDEVLIINATCDGGELVARAWCSENGQHAVVRKGSDTCFACAVKMASMQGLAVNCLIWA
ncbi:hypothetical protein V498_00285 [Pseudogymnoascus sp. VKM F-4517 (FW-2822)]|nr:hypothetical protein V498_00285 [Pseudogymnoascus sp. VKM F-4517 (FW-2822)]